MPTLRHQISIDAVINVIVFSFLYLVAVSPVFAQTQGEMNAKLFKDFQAIDKQLNIVYSKVLSLLDEQGKAKLVLSERAWLAFREAEATFEADTVARGGTMAPSIYNESRVDLTQVRIEQLDKLIQLVGK